MAASMKKVTSPNPSIKTNLKTYDIVPVFVVEYHHEALHHIYRSIGSKHLPLENIPMVHLDSHPDLGIPRDLMAEDIRDREKLLDELSIENWILPACLAGHLNPIVWVKPPWAQQLNNGNTDFYIGKHKETGRIKVTCSEEYFVSEGEFAAEDSICDKKLVNLWVGTLGDKENKPADYNQGKRSHQEDSIHHNKKVKISASDGSVPKHESSDESSSSINATNKASDTIESCDNVAAFLAATNSIVKSTGYILDIDLDFFSTLNPFKLMYSDKQYGLLKRLYNRQAECCQEGENITAKWQTELQKLRAIFLGLEKTGDLNSNDMDSHRHRLLEELVSDLKVNPPSEGIDWAWLHEVGCTASDPELPNHRSSSEEIDKLMCDVKAFLTGLPPPTIITISRSSADDYCPKDQVEMIQKKVLDLLRNIYGDINITLDYEETS